MLSSIILDDTEKVTNWILAEIPSEKNKPFNTNLERTMSNLVNGRVISKFNNSVFVQKSSSSLDSNFVLNLCKVYELNNKPLDFTNNFIH